MPIALVLAALLTPGQSEPAPAIARGTIAVERPAAVNRRPAPTAIYADGIESALIDAGFVAIPDVDHARYVARYDLKRTAQGAALAPGKAPGVVGGAAMLGTGAHVAVGLGSSTSVRSMVATELTLTITRRGESTPAWEGRAVTHVVSGTAADAPDAISRKLTGALIRNLNQPSGLMISIP
ncbi:hypothetical protein [Sphingomonas sp. RS2018]